MNLQELAAKTLKQIDRARALVAVNLRIEKLARRLVKMGWSPEYVGSTMLGAAVDMLQSAHVSREIIFASIEDGLKGYDSGNIKSAFGAPKVSDPGDTKQPDDAAADEDAGDQAPEAPQPPAGDDAQASDRVQLADDRGGRRSRRWGRAARNS